MGALIWIAIAAAALAALYGLDVSRQNIGKAKVRAELAPITEQCKAMGNEKPADCAVAIRTAITGRDTCLAANKSLDEQFATFRKMHNDAIEFEHQEYAKTQARKAAAKTESAPKLAEIAIEKFNMIVAAKGGGLSCDQMDDALLREAERRQRFYGAPTAAQQQRPPEVRIVEPPTTPARPTVVNPLKPKP